MQQGLTPTPDTPYNKRVKKGDPMKVYVTPDHDTSMVKSDYEVWEAETLAYAPDYYTIENDYDDDIDVV